MTIRLAVFLFAAYCSVPELCLGQYNSSMGQASQSILFPSVGDLLIGRVSNLHASSTCGAEQEQTYCPIGLSKCRKCDSKAEWDPVTNPNSHQIGNVVAKIRNSNTTYDSWWMSEPGVENVTIQLDLDTKFTFTHLIMIFHNYRPKAWWLERSDDFGFKYKPYAYFAENCEETFPWVKRGRMNKLDDVRCSSDYTEMTPSDKGQVVFNAIPQHLSETVFNDKSVDAREKRESQTDITNLRVHLLKYHTLSDEKLTPDSPERRKYYFGLYEMNVHGMCICNGHATTCRPADGLIPMDKSKVYGFCDCMHNTQGPHCEKCRDFYHDRRWAPASMTSANECRRCNCNGHSNRCEFSQEKWDSSGGKTGGVCQECMHNTTGVSCDTCVQGYYRDDSKLLDDPEICLPCKCSKLGSTLDYCQSETDKTKGGLIAGHCFCKQNVEGRKCDRCKTGYWNLVEKNPAGCQACGCTVIGSKDNKGCNMYTGACECKENVEGDNCEKCKIGFFNISASAKGCSPCNCNIGGSVSANCNNQTGECTCKRGFTGRQCDQVIDRFYVNNFEIEGTVVQVENSTEGGVSLPRVERSELPSLTGDCGVRLSSSSSPVIVILLRNKTRGLPTGQYDIVIKAYPVNISRQVSLPVKLSPGSDSINCTDRPPEIQGSLNLPSTRDFQADSIEGSSVRPYLVRPVFRRVCIDGSGLDRITVELFSLPSTDSVVLDAVIISKNLDDPIRHLLRRTEPTPLPPVPIRDIGSLVTDLYNCLDYWKSEEQSDRMPSDCKSFILGFSGRSLETALPCQCNMRGSRSEVCEKVGGNCYCYPNIVGQTCNECARNHFGFGRYGPQGCRFCNCSRDGSISQQCDDNGKCSCMPNIIGPQCDRCNVNHWNFPACLPCECNNMADDCNKDTGVCSDCRNNTGGNKCQECRTGYYGDPMQRIPCLRCPCPGGAVQHAATCSLESGSGTPKVKCNCEPGYLGDRCDQCAVNHYGHPTTGPCNPCSCNGNIDLTVPESCHPFTGSCTKCLNNTAGVSCEVCRPGFYGDATRGACLPCRCNANGTRRSSLLRTPIDYQGEKILYSCNSRTGECDCMPNVEGRSCTACRSMHYNFTSGEGCSACACDKVGSANPFCDSETGACSCRIGRGGRRCDQCLDLHYGNPAKVGPKGCQPCDCDPQGSMTPRCDKITGNCVCKSAITGRRCDQCERGTTGTLPNCTTCGECWYNWDKSIQQLTQRTDLLANRSAEAARIGGTTGDYSNEIRWITGQLDAVRRAVNETRPPESEVDALRRKLKRLEERFNAARPRLNESKYNLRVGLREIQNKDLPEMQRTAADLWSRFNAMKQSLTELRGNLSHPNLAPPSQTLAKIRRFEAHFNQQEDRLRRINNDLNSVEMMANTNRDSLNAVAEQATSLENLAKNGSGEAARKLAAVEAKLPVLNKQMCVGNDIDKSLYERNGNFCSAVCGGPPGICGSCGEASACLDSVAAQMRALDANLNGLERKLRAANLSLVNETESLTSVTGRANALKIKALTTEGLVNQLKTDYDDLKNRATDLEANIREFVKANHTTKQDIKDLVKWINSTSLPVNETGLSKLAEKIQKLSARLKSSLGLADATADMAAQRAEVSRLLLQAEAMVAKANQLKSQSEELRDRMKGISTTVGDGSNLLARVEQLLNEIQDVADTKLSSAIRTYENQTQRAKVTKSRLDASVGRASAQRTKLNYKINLLEKEQQETKDMLNSALTTADRINVEAAKSGIRVHEAGAAQREARIADLRSRMARLNQLLGGGPSQLHAVNVKIDSLEQSLTLSLDRLTKLTAKLTGDHSVPGSLKYMSNQLEKRCGNS
ncbi:hypothetical protein BOX15_Mlig003129g4 [Macrostomum lignano]|uniref:Uncharacterized protein n=1 Tax=Macrostomum lignano TaxID=282301 RepID=A0A267DCB5_9PLAT|nr:hypothetical protein BOX15_Mlig003129g4 [Macrostomum lignano]